MFAFVVSDLVFQYLAKRLAETNVSKIACFVSIGTQILNQLDMSQM